MGNISWRNFFKPEDFDYVTGLQADCATAANTKLWAAIQCEERVYGNIHDGGYHGKPMEWSVDNASVDTHSATLINIKKLGI